MPTVAVNRLALSTPAGHSTAARMRVEDALRLAALDDDRLFVFRRFDFGTLALAARSTHWQARADHTMRILVANAVHGDQASATTSNAVWFRSVNEARSLLLMRLVRGLVPSAWFWRLAVPEWAGESLGRWLPRLIMVATQDPAGRVTIARSLLRALANGDGAIVMAALAGLPEESGGFQSAECTREVATVPNGDHVSLFGQAANIVARVDIVSHALLAHFLSATGYTYSARHWLARLTIIAVAADHETQPSRSFALAAVMQTAAFWEQISVQTQPTDAAEAAPRPERSTVMSDRARPTRSPHPDIVNGEAVPKSESARSNLSSVSGQKSEITPQLSMRQFSEPSAAMHIIERPSTSGGLWLVIPALCRMGLTEWLDHRRGAEFAGFGHSLLMNIGLRQGVAADNPTLAPLSDDGHAPEQWLSAWRIGLDRWLRRRAEIRLCDLVRRPGGLRLDDANLTIRFDPGLADIGLRRRALDLDPGWVPWLGLVVRYQYRDRIMA